MMNFISEALIRQRQDDLARVLERKRIVIEAMGESAASRPRPGEGGWLRPATFLRPLYARLHRRPVAGACEQATGR
jgi:hypothetical protein